MNGCQEPVPELIGRYKGLPVYFRQFYDHDTLLCSHCQIQTKDGGTIDFVNQPTDYSDVDMDKEREQMAEQIDNFIMQVTTIDTGSVHIFEGSEETCNNVLEYVYKYCGYNPLQTNPLMQPPYPGNAIALKRCTTREAVETYFQQKFASPIFKDVTVSLSMQSQWRAIYNDFEVVNEDCEDTKEQIQFTQMMVVGKCKYKGSYYNFVVEYLKDNRFINIYVRDEQDEELADSIAMALGMYDSKRIALELLEKGVLTD